MNVSHLITQKAQEIPHKRAQVFSVKKCFKNQFRYEQYSFLQLEKRINQLSFFFKNNGVEKGDKVLILQTPNLDYCAMIFSLFRMGATPVLIDPGMGTENLLKCIEECAPRVMISVPLGYILKIVHGDEFKSVELKFSFNQIPLWGVKKIPTFDNLFEDVYETEELSDVDEAAILFTSGGTGKPKGVTYTHKIFIEQTNMLQTEFGLSFDDIDVPGFPLFGLFTLAMGMTSVIPWMNPSKPSKVNPEAMVQIILDQGATFVAGSPAIWSKVADYCHDKKIKLDSVKYVVMFGAPVALSLHEKFKHILTIGDTFTPYGATECLPITNYQGEEILDKTKEATLKGAGVCVGPALDGTKLKIIKITDNRIEHISLIEELPPMSKGEIIVSSQVVTPRYSTSIDATLDSKIFGDNGELWHRMGDVGYLDSEGKLWFCGRKSHLVFVDDETLFPICVEAIFNQHPEVRRSALVGVDFGDRFEAGIVIERVDGRDNLGTKKEELFFQEILNTASLYEHTKKIKHVFLHKKFPVDVRHNIKIDRIKLSEWASKMRADL